MTEVASNALGYDFQGTNTRTVPTTNMDMQQTSSIPSSLQQQQQYLMQRQPQICASDPNMKPTLAIQLPPNQMVVYQKGTVGVASKNVDTLVPLDLTTIPNLRLREAVHQFVIFISSVENYNTKIRSSVYLDENTVTVLVMGIKIIYKEMLNPLYVLGISQENKRCIVNIMYDYRSGLKAVFADKQKSGDSDNSSVVSSQPQGVLSGVSSVPIQTTGNGSVLAQPWVTGSLDPRQSQPQDDKWHSHGTTSDRVSYNIGGKKARPGTFIPIRCEFSSAWRIAQGKVNDKYVLWLGAIISGEIAASSPLRAGIVSTVHAVKSDSTQVYVFTTKGIAIVTSITLDPKRWSDALPGDIRDLIQVKYCTETRECRAKVEWETDTVRNAIVCFFDTMFGVGCPANEVVFGITKQQPRYRMAMANITKSVSTSVPTPVQTSTIYQPVPAQQEYAYTHGRIRAALVNATQQSEQPNTRTQASSEDVPMPQVQEEGGGDGTQKKESGETMQQKQRQRSLSEELIADASTTSSDTVKRRMRTHEEFLSEINYKQNDTVGNGSKKQKTSINTVGYTTGKDPTTLDTNTNVTVTKPINIP